MEWSSKSATNAYLETIKLCNKPKENCNEWETQEPESNEYLSALAAGMNSKVIVQVASEASPSTVALAAAAKQTGGKFLCILPEPKLNESKQTIKDIGLNDMVEFNTGDPIDVLPNIENIDFSLVDCATDDYDKLFDKLDVNPRRSVVVVNNLVEGRLGLGGHLKRVDNKFRVRSIKHPLGKSMEITMIGKSNERKKRSGIVKRSEKSKWVVEIDERSGEEHIFRIPIS